MQSILTLMNLIILKLCLSLLRQRLICFDFIELLFILNTYKLESIM